MAAPYGVCTLQTCQLQVVPFLHSASVWQSCAEPAFDCAPASATGEHAPVAEMSWQLEPADELFWASLAIPQQTCPQGHSLACRHSNCACG